MKNAAAITIFLLLPCLLKAQPETIVPNLPVVVGESFQVQYIFPANKLANFKPPAFRSFRFVTGPNQYTGSVIAINGTPVTNFVFTLEAVKKGRFKIPGAVATINGKMVKSNDAVIEVITQQEAQKLSDNSFNSDYTLRAGEDPYEKIRQNIFLKVMVDRTHCFVGEPVLATFKLYSRLQSRSDIIKNPGFYGFTVYDMVNLADKEMLTEEINGKLFDVHTIRKVQLFPLQEGLFTIDAMEVMNKVEFSRSVVNKKTEQEIVEGVLSNDEAGTNNENAEVYETKISTEPVLIRVQPLPNKPPDFDGAVGHFSISSSLVKSKIARNEEGVFEITIRGQGNFTQLNAPIVKWPAGIEGFEPVFVDSIDKTALPLKGSRSFRYSFTGAQPGSYPLAAISFMYFDPKGNYRTVSSAPLSIEISKEQKTYTVNEKKKGSIVATNASASRIAMIIVISLVILVIVYLIRDKKEPDLVKEEKNILPTVDELLGPAYGAIAKDDREFYSTLQQCIWTFFNTHFHLSGSNMSKDTLIDKMRSMEVDQENSEAIDSVLQNCEAAIFTQADLAGDKTELVTRTEAVLKKIRGQLSL